MYIKTDS